MPDTHDKSTVHAYQEQERLSSQQHRVLFHGYNLARYTGLLNSLFIAVGQTKISACDIQINDAFKCALLSGQGLARTMKESLGQNISSSIYELWSTTERLLASVEKAPGDTEMSNVPPLLHVVALVLYDHLRTNLLNDVCTYREIVPDVTLCDFMAKLFPTVDPYADDKESTVRNLTNILRAGNLWCHAQATSSL